jgi:hypothetical protein
MPYRHSHKGKTALGHLHAAKLEHLDRGACSAGVSNLTERLGFTNHDGQPDRCESAGQRDVLLDLEPELAVVRVVGLRGRLEVYGAGFCISLIVVSQCNRDGIVD